MIQIRNGMFETNSSSVHALIIKDTAQEKLRSIVDLSADSSTGDIVRAIVRDLDEEDTKMLVNWLYSHGVETIKYHGSNRWLNEFAENYKDNYSDTGIPYKLRDLNSDALINLLMGHFTDYFGSDDDIYGHHSDVVYILDYFS